MTSTNDPFTSQPGDGTAAPAAPSWEQAAPVPVDALPPAPGYAQAPYSQAQYAQAPYAPTPTKTWMNIASLVTSLVGLGLFGIIFGHLGVAAAKRGEAEYKGLGIAGLVLGYVGVVGTLLWLILVAGLVASGGFATS